MNPAEGLSPRIALAATRQLRGNGGISSDTVRTIAIVVGPEVANAYHVEVVPIKDKHYRKFATGVERALSLFDTALEEWADYISFLNRLLKVRDIFYLLLHDKV